MVDAVRSFADASHAQAVSPPAGALVVLLVVLAASSLTLWVLIRRATSHRRWVALSEWARDSGFRYRPEALAKPPPPLDAMRGVRARVRICLSDGRSTLVEAVTDSQPAPATGTDAPKAWGGDPGG